MANRNAENSRSQSDSKRLSSLEPGSDCRVVAVKGNGPMNRDRIDHKVAAWEEGAWVREAAVAHAAKKAARAA